MSERVNRLAFADWHNSAVADEAGAVFQMPLRPAWIDACSVTTDESVLGVGFQRGQQAQVKDIKTTLRLARHLLE